MITRRLSSLKAKGRAQLVALTVLPRAFRLVWLTNWKLTLVLGTTTILQGLLPAARAWSGKLIIDGVVNSIMDSSTDMSPLMPVIGIALGVAFADQFLTNIAQLTQDLLRDLLGQRINTLIVEKAASLDLSYYETATFYDMLQRARQEANYRPLTIMQQIFALLRGVITLVSLVGLLFRFNPWVLVLLIVSGIPTLVLHYRLGWASVSLHNAQTQTMRELNYFGLLLTDKRCIKEVKLFELGETFLGRYKGLYTRLYKQNRNLTVKRNVSDLFIQTLGQAGYFGAYFFVIAETLQKRITLGDLTMYSSILIQTQAAFGTLMLGLANLNEQNLFLTNLFAFLKLEPRIVSNGKGRRISDQIQTGIELKNVSFRYPAAPAPVLSGINLTIKPGERLAIVGQNGAGKTTLVKLLTRLYDPSEGSIHLDGVDLREINPSSLYAQIGVIFQDFVHYYLTGRENIGLGCVGKMHDDISIQAAARKSGIHETLVALPTGYETTLGRAFNDNGPDLSIGQWQKIALARAYLRDAPILVLDEPTASLDAQAEYDVFKQFRDLAQNRIVILISHRFSTVRLADRIVVIDNGCIVEEGSHEELLAAGGQYATMFNLQAEGYQ